MRNLLEKKEMVGIRIASRTAAIRTTTIAVRTCFFRKNFLTATPAGCRCAAAGAAEAAAEPDAAAAADFFSKS